MSETAGEIDRGPNGWPYLNLENSTVSAWENGEFILSLERDDGEVFKVNVRGDELEAFQKAIGSTRTRAAEPPEVEYDE